ncbi:hypothetical protein [Streptomyces sp. NPDC005533]|uniref:hypothetical protein n=1 Tax=Streptomyces sp. NPDC005533 TaxID=3364723 RepID=UPI0036981EA7
MALSPTGRVFGAWPCPGPPTYRGDGRITQLKAESGFADVLPEDMTREQMRELAARYNGGPYCEGSGAQAYGRLFDGNLGGAGRALR